MEQNEIVKTVALHVSSNLEHLAGALKDPGYFTRQGVSFSEMHREPDTTVRGYAIDVLADMIETGKFFGWEISENWRQGSNMNVSTVRQVTRGQQVSNLVGTIQYQGVDIEEIPMKDYINALRTYPGFVDYLKTGVIDEGGVTWKMEESPETIADVLFGRS